MKEDIISLITALITLIVALLGLANSEIKTKPSETNQKIIVVNKCNNCNFK